MGLPKNDKHLNQMAQDEHDTVSYRKRVADWADLNDISYEGSLTSGTAILDVNTDLGRLGHDGWILNDGTGNMTVSFSYDGNTYGGAHTLKPGETFTLERLSVSKIKLNWIANTTYRVLVV